MSQFLKLRNLTALLKHQRQWHHTLNKLTPQIQVISRHQQHRGTARSVQQPQVQSAPLDPEAVLKDVKQYKIGQKLHGFVVQEVEEVPEFQLRVIRLKHTATGGEYLHIDRNDANNVFSVGFRTTPNDSTGLPHILEHTTLCGSKKYPCRDPFFKMLNRSLATFMNAMTAPDSTFYPFSTQNSKDFKNLLSVYLDAVFEPNLRETDFRQEGWRLEHSNAEDPNSPIIFKGVVFNEMKGVFADNQNLFGYALMNNLLPSNTYGVCSGGDPLEIPNLLHQDLKNFHKKYYSPSNTRYYSYGNIPFESHLKYLNDAYLERFHSKETISTTVAPQVRWSKPVRKHISCPIDKLAADQNKQSSIAVSYLCCGITDIEENFALQVLAELLVKSPNSAFYKTLVEPNIGSGLSPSTGYESDVLDTFFTVGLQGVSENDFEKILKICEETFDEVIEKGFDQKRLEAILHTIEINCKHQSANFGLAVLFSISSVWNHDGNVVKSLQIENLVKNFREKMEKDPKYLQKKVKKYFKDNNHKLILTMSPDPNYEEQFRLKEEKLLQEKLSKLTPEEKKKIYEDGLELLKEQGSDDKSCLPTLGVSDLQKDVDRVEFFEEKVKGVPFRIIPQPTNGITYFRGILNTDRLSVEHKALLPLFAYVSTKMGTKKRNFKEFDLLATLKTKDLVISGHMVEDTKTFDKFEEGLVLHSFCLNKNVDDMFGLWSEVFQEMDFSDKNRFETLVKSLAASLGNSLTQSGSHYAMLSAASLVSASGWAKEQSGGMTFVRNVTKIAQKDTAELLPVLEEIYKETISKSRLRCALNLLNGTEDAIIEKTGRLIESLSGEVEEKWPVEKKNQSSKQRGMFYQLPFPISYAAKSVVTVPLEHKDHSSLRVLTRLMTMKYLHPEIREKGGAYGGGVSLSSSGLLNFYSYRDPNPLNSLQTFDNSLEWLKKGEFTPEDVDEAKLGVFQNIDRPVPPGSKGMRDFLDGFSDDVLQRHRLQLMSVTKDDLLVLADRYLDENKDKSLVGRCVIGPENKTITDNASQDWTVINSN